MTNNDHIVRLALIGGLALVWWLALIPGLIDLIGPKIRPHDGESPTDMVLEIRMWSTYVVVVATVVALLWYAYGVSQPIDQWSGVNHRTAWSLFLLATGCMAVYAGFSLTTVASGAARVWAVYAVLGCGLYYFASVLASPTRWKYTPPLAVYFRKLVV
jgi:hypothetical protein